MALEEVDLENFNFPFTNLTLHIPIFQVNEDFYLYFYA